MGECCNACVISELKLICLFARYAYEAIFVFANGLTGLFNNSLTGSYSPSEIATVNAAAALSGQIRTRTFAGKVQNVVNVSEGNVNVAEIRISNYRPQQTDAPTVAPSTAAPNQNPTAVPTEGSSPTTSPTTTRAPSRAPTDAPENNPTTGPTTTAPTAAPTGAPTHVPRCEDDKFGSVNFCSQWCNNTNHWGNCAANTIIGADPINTDNADYTCSCQGCNGCAARCDDKTLFGNGTAWHSSAGSWYDCAYYGLAQGDNMWGTFVTQVTNCDSQGDDSNQGITAYSACCACGGGNRDSVHVAGGGGALATGATCAASPDTLNGMVLQLTWLESTYDITVGEAVIKSDASTRRRSPMQWSARYNGTVSNSSHQSQNYNFTLYNTSSYSTSCADSVFCADGLSWHDSDGPAHSCAWYEGTSNCGMSNMNQFSNCGHNAQQACCACGAKQAAEVEFKCGSSTLITGTSSYSTNGVEMQVIQLETPKCCTEPEPTISPTVTPTNPPACFPHFFPNASQTIGAPCSDNSQCKSDFCGNIAAPICMCESPASQTVVAAAVFVESDACDGSDRPNGVCSFKQVGTYTKMGNGRWEMETSMESIMFPNGNGAIPPSASTVTVGVLIPSVTKYNDAISSATETIQNSFDTHSELTLLAGYAFKTAVEETDCHIGQGPPDLFSYSKHSFAFNLSTMKHFAHRSTHSMNTQCHPCL